MSTLCSGELIKKLCGSAHLFLTDPRNHLLYADDVILLSTSNSGSQHNIDMVHKFCNNWGLSINANKSRVMVFSKNGKVNSNMEFRIGQKILELVSVYKYLGINITLNGKFLKAEKILSLKASRALFSVKQSLFDNKIKTAAMLRKFDSLIKPTATYNS